MSHLKDPMAIIEIREFLDLKLNINIYQACF